jgi:hypothetical protein
VVDQWMSTYNTMKFETYLIPSKKINTKWITDLNVNWETINHREDNTRENPGKLGLASKFLDETPQAWPRKEKFIS